MYVCHGDVRSLNWKNNRGWDFSLYFYVYIYLCVHEVFFFSISSFGGFCKIDIHVIRILLDFGVDGKNRESSLDSLQFLRHRLHLHLRTRTNNTKKISTFSLPRTSVGEVHGLVWIRDGENMRLSQMFDLLKRWIDSKVALEINSEVEDRWFQTSCGTLLASLRPVLVLQESILFLLLLRIFFFFFFFSNLSEAPSSSLLFFSFLSLCLFVVDRESPLAM